MYLKDNMNNKDYLTNLFFTEEIEDYDERSESFTMASARINEMQLDEINEFVTTTTKDPNINDLLFSQILKSEVSTHISYKALAVRKRNSKAA
ncbi:6704_t:CDS:2 [Funneliformis caledonium]|uniref:6704_t:CDS:1 n=1 Tax=Funneliformis caledonium TaxID=1117310 RepID=A0A9N8ZTK4_9GLOM|nr:6704_t:CDS:2 [Funneliformis caledonium]